MKIKSNKLSKSKERAKENLRSVFKSSLIIIIMIVVAYGLYYFKHHRDDDLMVKIQAKKYQLFDNTFGGVQNNKVYSYKVVKVDGYYKVEIFDANGNHSHYADPSVISIVEQPNLIHN